MHPSFEVVANIPNEGYRNLLLTFLEFMEETLPHPEPETVSLFLAILFTELDFNNLEQYFLNNNGFKCFAKMYPDKMNIALNSPNVYKNLISDLKRQVDEINDNDLILNPVQQTRKRIRRNKGAATPSLRPNLGDICPASPPHPPVPAALGT